MTSTQDTPTVAPPVAPHVARSVGRSVAEDPEAVAEVLGRLAPDQLAGAAVLPDPLPVTPAVRAVAGPVALDDTARRVLLAAAVLVVDRVDVLLGATDVPVDRLLAPPLAGRLRLADGRFRLVDPALRAVVHEDAELDERTRVHAALAAELARAGEPAAARWHAALSTLAGDPALADDLVALAEDRLARGGTVSAHAVAREAASHGTGEVRARAFLAAGRAALASGHLDDAAAWLDRVRSTGVDDVRADAERARLAVRALRGEPAGEGSGADAAARDEPPGSRLARLVVPVARAAVSDLDRAALVAVVDALARLDLRPRQADAVLARAVVAAAPARERGVWTEREAMLSPLAEAHLRVVQALALHRGGDGVQAVRVLGEAAGRLPVAHVVGGLATALLRCGAGGGARPAEALGEVGPEPVAAASAVCRVDARCGAPAAPESLTASAVRTCAVLPGPAGPGRGDVWERWAGVLTPRELDVARLVAEGMANKQVAERLCVSVRTVEVHLGRVFRKVGVRSRAELTVRVLRDFPYPPG